MPEPSSLVLISITSLLAYVWRQEYLVRRFPERFDAAPVHCQDLIRLRSYPARMLPCLVLERDLCISAEVRCAPKDAGIRKARELGQVPILA
jgi:hypothetical protein